MKTEHKQVIFVDHNGNRVKVDKKLLEFLEMFRELGLISRASCQGSEKRAAYVSFDGRGGLSFVKMVLKLYLARKYSKTTRRMIKSFRNGYREVNFGHFLASGTFEFFRISYSKGNFYMAGHSFEVSYSREYGFGMVLRWPKEETDLMCLLLTETYLASQK
jgi:hypothetical protein